MGHLIGNRKDIKLSFNDRAEIIRLQEEGMLVSIYEYLIARVNEYDISIWEDRFYSEMTGEEMTMNHLVCLLRNDIVANSRAVISQQLAAKITTWLLKALVDCCLENGIVQLDATKILSRLGFSSQIQADLKS